MRSATGWTRPRRTASGWCRRRGVARREVLQRLALAAGTAEKAVALVYERNRRPEQLHWKDWQDRVVDQVRGGLAALDAAVPETGWSADEGPDAADVSAVIAYQFVEAVNPWVLEPGYPRLAALAERAMQLPAVAGTKPPAP